MISICLTLDTSTYSRKAVASTPTWSVKLFSCRYLEIFKSNAEEHFWAVYRFAERSATSHKAGILLQISFSTASIHYLVRITLLPNGNRSGLLQSLQVLYINMENGYWWDFVTPRSNLLDDCFRLFYSDTK